MGLTEALGDAVADRAYQLIGVLFGAAAIAHFALWAQAPDHTFDTAVAAGDVGAAAPAAVTYAQGHPAYVLAFLVGAALLVRQP